MTTATAIDAFIVIAFILAIPLAIYALGGIIYLAELLRRRNNEKLAKLAARHEGSDK